MSKITSRVIETREIEWRKAKWFQNKDLKDLDEDGMERLKNSLRNNQFIMPFHIWREDETDWILDGHHRQLALQAIEQEGFSVPDMLPATFVKCDDKEDAAKLVLVYSSAYAKISRHGLEEFMSIYNLDLQDFQMEVDLPDFSMPRFEQLFFPLPSLEEDDVASIDNQTPITLGDVFRLGPHLLACADFQSFDFTRYIGGKLIRMVFTDPPYNLPANYICGAQGAKRHNNFAMGAGEMNDMEFVGFLEKIMQTSCDLSVDGAIHYVCMDFRHAWHMCQAASSVYGSVEPKQICVWNKNQGANGSFYRAKHELVFIFKHGKAKHKSHLQLVDRVRYNVWDYASANSLSNPDRDQLGNHPTPKPVNMIIDAILDVSDEGDYVADFFLGSGSTLIAVDYSKRICVGSEIEPTYCHHIIKRWLTHCEKTGQKPNFEHLNGTLTLEHL